jgi:hypothetical protein
VRPQRFACRPAPPPSTNSLTRRDRNRQWPRLGSGRPTPLRTSASPQTPPVLLDSRAGFKKFISGFHASSPPPATGTPSRPCCAKSRRPARCSSRRDGAALVPLRPNTGDSRAAGCRNRTGGHGRRCLAVSRPKLLSELLSNRPQAAGTTTKEARNELENWWARLGSNQRPADYESAALTS